MVYTLFFKPWSSAGSFSGMSLKRDLSQNKTGCCNVVESSSPPPPEQMLVAHCWIWLLDYTPPLTQSSNLIKSTHLQWDYMVVNQAESTTGRMLSASWSATASSVYLNKQRLCLYCGLGWYSTGQCLLNSSIINHYQDTKLLYNCGLVPADRRLTGVSIRITKLQQRKCISKCIKQVILLFPKFKKNSEIATVWKSGRKALRKWVCVAFTQK